MELRTIEERGREVRDNHKQHLSTGSDDDDPKSYPPNHSYNAHYLSPANRRNKELVFASIAQV
jgi:hypothetical protein